LRVVSRIAVAPLVAVPDRLARMRRELQVGAVVTGSVRVVQRRVRVNVVLVDTESKETLWSDTYDRSLEDIFAVQSDVATRIAVALHTRLSGTDEDRLRRAPTNSLEAYQRLLQAGDLADTDPNENRRAIALLREAVRLDPAFALAYADLAGRLDFLGNYGDPRFYAEALDAAKQAVAADSSDPRTFHALAVAYMQVGRYPDAKLAFLKALDLGPNAVGAMFDLSIAEADSGRFDQSLYWARRAFVLAPNVERAYYHMAVPLNTLDERDVAARWLREAEQRFPTSTRIQLMLADVEFFHERNPGSITRLERLLAAHGDNQEVNGMLTEQYFITGSPKADARIEALFRNAPDGMTGGSLPETFRTLYAYLLRRRGQVQRASDLLRIAQATAEDKLRAGDGAPELRMELAAIHALNGQHAEAVRWLQAAHEAGWLFFRETLRDPLFSGLAGDPGFTQAIEQMQRQIATMRARIRVEDNPVPPARPPVDQRPR
jgi:tetratricopeptide (TPR) repeat protein